MYDASRPGVVLLWMHSGFDDRTGRDGPPMRRPSAPMLALAVLAAVVVPKAATAAQQICVGLLFGGGGTRVGVPLTLDDGQGVAGIQIDLHFDPAVVTPAG